jgi:hypothetical protein
MAVNQCAHRMQFHNARHFAARRLACFGEASTNQALGGVLACDASLLSALQGVDFPPRLLNQWLSSDAPDACGNVIRGAV